MTGSISDHTTGGKIVEKAEAVCCLCLMELPCSCAACEAAEVAQMNRTMVILQCNVGVDYIGKGSNSIKEIVLVVIY